MAERVTAAFASIDPMKHGWKTMGTTCVDQISKSFMDITCYSFGNSLSWTSNDVFVKKGERENSVNEREKSVNHHYWP